MNIFWDFIFLCKKKKKASTDLLQLVKIKTPMNTIFLLPPVFKRIWLYQAYADSYGDLFEGYPEIDIGALYFKSNKYNK